MAISKPLLPPMPGYVEVIDENGNHVYKPTKATLEKQKQEKSAIETQQIVTDLLGGDSNVGNEPQAALEFNRAVQLYITTIEDEAVMLSIPSIYPEYKIGNKYKTKDVFRYGTNSVGDPQLYQVLQDHTSSEEYPVETSVSLYKKIGIGEDGTPTWVQPLGATDAYMKDDVVIHNEKKCKSTIDNNVWEPGVYGWELVDGSSESGEPSTDIPEWKQPSGSHDAYSIGDKVTHNGKTYISTADNNVWEPGVYGWELVE